MKLSELSSGVWDAVVIGAGPTGATSAYQLARAGYRVLLVERATFPRDKVCGCCLSGEAVSLLHRIGLASSLAAGIPLERFELGSGGRTVTLQSRGGMALSRRGFDSGLVEAAIDAGATFCEGTTAALSEMEPITDARSIRLTRTAELTSIQAQLVLLAGGLGSVRATTRQDVLEHIDSRVLVGLTTLLSEDLDKTSASLEPGCIRMAVGRDGYVGLTKLEDGRTNVSAAVLKTALKRDRSPAMLVSKIIAGAGFRVTEELSTNDWMGTRDLTRRLQVPAARRLFVLGDAAGYVEPFTGQGMSWGIAASIAVQPLAAQAIDQWDDRLIDSWSACMRRLMFSRQLTCRSISLLIRRPALATMTVRALQLAPVLASPFFRSIHGPCPQKRQLVT